MYFLDDIKRLYRIQVNGQSPRYMHLNFLERCLKGTQYNDLPYNFFQKSNFSGQALPMEERKPAVIYNLPKIIVDRSTDMLFGDEHWPTVHIEDPDAKDTEKAIDILVRFSSFNRYWRKAARMGSVGSVAVIFKIIERKLYHEVLNAKDCTPYFHPIIPNEVVKIRQQFQIKGQDLVPYGYSGLEPTTMYWYTRDFDERSEVEYFPIKVADATKAADLNLSRNDLRSFNHDLGFLPGVWIKNLESEDKIDGESTFEAVINFQHQLDYQLSYIGRVFKYTGDPLLALKDPSILDPNGTGEGIVNQQGNALILNEDGDAFMVEIQADAQKKAMEYTEKLRKLALEIGRGNRADPDKLAAVQSGKALALLHKDIIGLVGELRVSYGNDGLVPYLLKVLKAMEKYEIAYPGMAKLKVKSEVIMDLRWGAYFEPTNEDHRSLMMAITEAINNGTISEELGTKLVAPVFDISDVAAVREQISKQRDEEMARAKELEMHQQLAQQKKAGQVGKSSSSAPPEK
jgi:hypothetical protein